MIREYKQCRASVGCPVWNTCQRTRQGLQCCTSCFLTAEHDTRKGRKESGMLEGANCTGLHEPTLHFYHIFKDFPSSTVVQHILFQLSLWNSWLWGLNAENHKKPIQTPKTGKTLISVSIKWNPVWILTCQGSWEQNVFHGFPTTASLWQEYNIQNQCVLFTNKTHISLWKRWFLITSILQNSQSWRVNSLFSKEVENLLFLPSEQSDIAACPMFLINLLQENWKAVKSGLVPKPGLPYSTAGRYLSYPGWKEQIWTPPI